MFYCFLLLKKHAFSVSERFSLLIDLPLAVFSCFTASCWLKKHAFRVSERFSLLIDLPLAVFACFTASCG